MPRKKKQDSADEQPARTPVRRRGNNALQPEAIEPDHQSSAAASTTEVASDSICPHCAKLFRQELGLKYHVDNFVCRPELKPKKSPRKNERVASEPTEEDNEDSESSGSDDENVAKEPEVTDRKRGGVRSLRSLPVRKRAKVVRSYCEDESNSDESESAQDDDLSSRKSSTSSVASEDDAKEASSKPQARSASKKTSVPDDLMCPHCNKTFRIAAGYLYHVDNFVCRQELRPGGPVKKGKRKLDASLSTEYKRIRGKAGDRTCPKCKRVFTSVHGLKYHVDKNVCVANLKRGSIGADDKPFPALESGLQFVTKFGVVQVVADDRALPTAVFGDDYKKQIRRFTSNTKIAHEKRRLNFYLMKTQEHLEKRVQLSSLYATGNVSQALIFTTAIGVYHPSVYSRDGSYPPTIPAPVPPSDPSEPDGSHPDRIVECVVIADDRKRFLGDNDKTPLHVHPLGNVGCKMYLQRRLLVAPYVEQHSLYCCSICGQEFESKGGLKYHVQSELCLNRAKNAMAAQKERLQSLSEKANEPRKRVLSSGNKMVHMLAEELPARRIYTLKRERSIANVSVYPQVYLALGIKLLPRSDVPVKRSTVSAFKEKRGYVRNDHESANDEAEEETAEVVISAELPMTVPSTSTKRPKHAPDKPVDPRVVLADLEKKLKLEQAKQLGPIYPFAFRTLGYRKPGKKKKRRKVPKKLGSEVTTLMEPPLEKDDGVKIEAPRVNPPLPPAPPASRVLTPHNHRLLHIDTCVLIDEVETQRFPSMKRNGPNVEHETVCYLCKTKDDVPMFQCQFCKHSVHRLCMYSRYIVKEPEFDDFMCSDCINYIHHRRKRAEKRRLEKLGLLGKNKQDPDELKMLAGVVEGREYESLLVQGARVAELTELLEHTRTRLTRSFEAAKVDEMRYASIASTEQGINKNTP